MTTREIAELLDGKLIGNGDLEITSVAAIDSACARSISFLDRPDADITTNASAVIVPLDHSSPISAEIIKVHDPKLAFARVAAILHPSKRNDAGVHTSTVIAETAVIGDEVSIGPFVTIGNNSAIGGGTQILAGAHIGDDVTIGNGCIVHSNVTIEDGCIVGDNVVLHAGVVIGADGFGYVRDKDEYVKFPQIGTVVIEDDVEIGANSCIDRGALGETRIGKGSKIDNLVQIAHNVQIGERVIIAAQTGISGSTVIEDDCVIGGQVGMGDHARVLKGAIIGSQAGVLPGKIVREGVWWGTPVQPLDEYKRQNAHVKGLERLKAQLKELRSRVDALHR